MMSKTTVINPGDNIFEVLNVPNATYEKMRLDLMVEITNWFKSSGLSQVQAAEKLGCNQPQLSLVLKGKYEEFTIDRLVKMVINTGKDVSLNIHQHVA